MHRYVAYGLDVSSELPFPELPANDARHGTESGDVVVRLGSVPRVPSKLNEAGMGFWATASEACHLVDKVGAFLVRHGQEIVVDPAPGFEERVLRLSILGPALGLLLHQRGLLVLHASVVARSADAFAFLGNNGWGKSTIAAALYARGYDLVADDVAAVAIDSGGPTVFPSFPQVKLWPEPASLLGETPEHLPLLHPGFDKRGWRVARGFSTEPRQLKGLYVLAPGPSPAIEPVEPREACLELLSHWYGHRFDGALLEAGAAAVHLQQCVVVAGRVPMRRLRRTGGSSTLLHLAELVDADLTRPAATESSAR